MLTVHSLRKQNIKVMVSHLRRYYRYDDKTGKKLTVNTHKSSVKPGWTLDHFGGETVVQITLPDNVTYTAQSTCNNEDRYCNREGVSVALKRLERFVTNG